MKKVIVLLLIILSVAHVVAEENTVVYYVNPNGGSYYHAVNNCASMRSEYWSELQEVTEEQLRSGEVGSYKKCGKCFATSMTATANLKYWYFSSADIEKEEMCLRGEQLYEEGTDLEAGIYTIKPITECSGEIVVYSGATKLRTFSIDHRETTYSFYLGEDMAIWVPQGCVLNNFKEAAHFQDQSSSESFEKIRMLTHYQLPGFRYFVTNVEGKEGRVTIYSINAEVGAEEPQTIIIDNGETIELNLQQRGDEFVEIEDCIFWPAEIGVG